MPIIGSEGAASSQGFGQFARTAVATYIEDVFSTFLYTGNGSTQTITNGIDLAGKGGLVWLKSRTQAESNQLYDTVRGAGFQLRSNTTGAQFFSGGSTGNLDQFTSSGFTLGSDSNTNASGQNYASWTFREQPKFFDCVTWTGNDVNGRQITHNLGSTPGCIMVKSTSLDGTDWVVHHRSLGFSQVVYLNSTVAAETTTRITAATSTTFTISDASTLNSGGATYVAYLFAHNAGGFGLTGTDNVISCGSFTGPTATVDLGYEPQWLLTKRVDSTGNWTLMDTMRGLVGSSSSGGVFLQPNTSNAENSQGQYTVNATGFNASVGVTSTFIYIAIRRGPMKTPTTGTSVMNTLTWTGNGAASRYISGVGFPSDLVITSGRAPGDNKEWDDRLRGWGSTAANALFSNNTNAESTDAGSVQYLYQDGPFVRVFNNGSGATYCAWNFRRAPGFFDVVCYTGNNSTGQSINHNLGVVPELYICKRRNGTQGGDDWQVYCSYLSSPLNSFLRLVSNAANGTNTDAWQAPTATQIKIGAGLAGYMNASGGTYVAYLFASCPGVSKVGSYTGTGTTQTINCGFTAGSRFVMIKRTDSTGDWYVWDSARGIVAGNDPYLLLNSTAAEVTNTDFVDTAATGFEISSTAPAAINASGGTFIFLAIA